MVALDPMQAAVIHMYETAESPAANLLGCHPARSLMFSRLVVRLLGHVTIWHRLRLLGGLAAAWLGCWPCTLGLPPASFASLQPTHSC